MDSDSSSGSTGARARVLDDGDHRPD